MKTRGVVCTAASLVLAAASLALCALASTWGPQEGKRAELAEAQAVSPRLLEQVELARAVRLGEVSGSRVQVCDAHGTFLVSLRLVL
jgi:hypothetical protein